DLGMSAETFTLALESIAKKYLPTECQDDQRIQLWKSLRVEELALARACSAGNEKAWEIFLTRYREALYNAGRSITRDDATARELADSLYADLYGMRSENGERRSKLDYYMGRGSLEGWLRTVLAQEYINRYRAQKKLVSIEEEEEGGAQFA